MLNPNVNPKPKLKPKSRMIKSGCNLKMKQQILKVLTKMNSAH